MKGWLTAARAQTPEVELFDAHTHFGENDPDGVSGTPEQLLDGLKLADARAVVFPMHEPGGYRPANDRVREAAAASDGRLVPFARLDPRADPLAEAERSFDAGARGIKLHPRAERFALSDPAMRDVFALAAERHAPVLVHAGRGIPALGRDAVDLCDRHPGLRLILAHCGISDLSWLATEAVNHPGLFFDTAWWGTADMLTLLKLVPPGQVLFGSDAPYGTTLSVAVWILRHARQLGLSDDQIRLVCGGQLARLVAWEDPADGGDPPGSPLMEVDLILDRVHTYLTAALGPMFRGVVADESFALARLACDVPGDAPQAPAARAVLELLDARDRYAERVSADSVFAPGTQLVITAMVATRTPDVPFPRSAATA